MTGVDESLITPTVVALLDAEMSCPVGYGAPPSPVPPATRLEVTVGWLAVYVIPLGVIPEPGWSGQSGAMETLEYQLTAGGASQEHASALANEAASVLTDRAGGLFVHALAPAGHTVMNRRRAGRLPDQPGAEWFASSQRVWLLAHRSA